MASQQKIYRIFACDVKYRRQGKVFTYIGELHESGLPIEDNTMRKKMFTYAICASTDRCSGRNRNESGKLHLRTRRIISDRICRSYVDLSGVPSNPQVLRIWWMIRLEIERINKHRESCTPYSDVEVRLNRTSRTRIDLFQLCSIHRCRCVWCSLLEKRITTAIIGIYKITTMDVGGSFITIWSIGIFDSLTFLVKFQLSTDNFFVRILQIRRNVFAGTENFFP